MGMFDLANEKKLIEDVESLGFYYAKAVPHLNYDQYYFERDLGDKGIYTVVVEFNGDKYSLAYGVDYRVQMVRTQFELSYEEIQAYLTGFASLHNIKLGGQKNG
jgi:hypothetical protein